MQDKVADPPILIRPANLTGLLGVVSDKEKKRNRKNKKDKPFFLRIKRWQVNRFTMLLPESSGGAMIDASQSPVQGAKSFLSLSRRCLLAAMAALATVSQPCCFSPNVKYG
jgi:hypothetical protein